MNKSFDNVRIIFLTLCVCTLLLIFLISCGRRSIDDSVELLVPLTPKYSEATPNYLVSTESYVRIYSERSLDSKVLHIARKGDVFIILRPVGQDETGYVWYEIVYNDSKGWILTLDPLLLNSVDQAKYLK